MQISLRPNGRLAFDGETEGIGQALIQQVRDTAADTGQSLSGWKMGTRVRAVLAAALVAALAAVEATAAEWRPAERWRGFNLVARFWHQDASEWPLFAEFKQDFDEFDFQFMHDFGFNFARVPIDCRLWYKDGNQDVLDDAKVAQMVDPLLAWGAKYGVHVSLCFYYAPGYSIAGRASQHDGETLDLATNPQTLARFARHWAYFAKRYKGIPNERLSFNLFNEPNGGVMDRAYGAIARRLVAAIRAEDPERFVIADGIACATVPAKSLVDVPNLGQAFRGYRPTDLTHYRAIWAGNPGRCPTWPPRGTLPSAIQYGPVKGDWHKPLMLENLPAGKLTLRLGTVSGTVKLVATADGRRVLEKSITMRPDDPACVGAVFHTQWSLCQGRYTKPFEIALDRPVTQFSVMCEAGDWFEIDRLSFTDAQGRTTDAELQHAWGVRADNNGFRYRAEGAQTDLLPLWLAQGPYRYRDVGMEYLYRCNQKILDDFTAGAGRNTFVMIGEFGCHRYTPHHVMLGWLEDNLKLWKERNLGWAMWNLRGPMGVVDSGRSDIEYEDYRGHKVDRGMLDLLRKY